MQSRKDNLHTEVKAKNDVPIKQGKNVQLTAKDIEIIRFINQFGFCCMKQLKQQFGLKEPHCYRLIRRLIKLGLLTHQFIFHKQGGVYQATTKGAQFTNLPPLFKVPLATYYHQLKVVDVAVQLLKQFPESSWISERQLAQDVYFNGFGVKGHVADGVLVLKDGRQVCVEVELTQKSKSRMAQIFKSYSTFFQVKEVWYVCPKQLLSLLKPQAQKYTFVKFFSLEELI